MAISLYGVGASALSAAQTGLLTAGHNIANANTPGYSRQRVEQLSNAPQYTGVGYIGQGVHVESIRRQYDDLLAAEYRSAQSQASHSQAYSDQLARIDALLSNPSSGVSPAVDDFFAGVNDMAANPSDPSARQNLLSAAESLASRFNEMDGQLEALRKSTNERIVASVGEINSLGAQIARLNKQIAMSSNGGTVPPNDLLDKRDTLLGDLSKQTAVRVVVADSGDYNLFLGSGQALVLGEHSYSITTRSDPLDPQNLQVGLQTGSSLSVFRSTDLAGGTLGGLLAFRDEALGAAQNAVGRVALALGAAFNAQQNLGLDRNGNPGASLFSVGAPQVLTQSAASLSATISDYSALTTSDYRLDYEGANYTLTRQSDGNQTTFATFPQTIDGLTLDFNPPVPAPLAGDSFLIEPTRNGASRFGVLLGDTGLLAAAAPIRTAASMANTGNGQISAGRVTAGYSATPLAAPVSLVYSAATGTLSGFPPGSAVNVTLNGVTTAYAAGAPVGFAAGATIAWDGIEVELAGAPQDGDTYTIAPNTAASGDNRNALALAALQTDVALGGSTLQQAYGGLTSFIGNKSREMQVAADAQNSLVSQVQAARAAVSGVNLDEEAADLIRFQQAYQAAGKMMGIASTLFDTILALGR